MQPKILVRGFYSKKNIGDESYKLSFPLLFPQYDFTFSSNSFENELDAFDACVLGGGDILTQELVSQTLIHPRHILSACISKNCDKLDLGGFKHIAVRDKNSHNVLKNCGTDSLIVPDFGFALKGNKVRGKEIITNLFKKEERDLYDKVIIVVINSYLVSNPATPIRQYLGFEKFINDLSLVLDNVNASVILLPFCTSMPHDDRLPSARLLSCCKFWKKMLICYEADVKDCLDMISASDAVMSSRLHSTIFSIANGVPFVDITHNHKNSALLDDLEMNDRSVNYWAFHHEEAKEKLDRCLNKGFDDLTPIVDSLSVKLKEFANNVCLI